MPLINFLSLTWCIFIVFSMVTILIAVVLRWLFKFFDPESVVLGFVLVMFISLIAASVIWDDLASVPKAEITNEVRID